MTPLSSDHPASGDSSTAEILARCLTAIEGGEATIESCVAQYPDFANLGDLLYSSQLALKLPLNTLRDAAKADIRERMLAKHRAVQVQARPAQRTISFSWWRRVAMPVAATLVILFGGGTALVRASDSALPGDGLYGLKRTVEQIELSLADHRAWPDLLYRDARIRLEEMSILTARSQPLTDAIIRDVAQSISAAVAVQPDRSKSAQLVVQAQKIFELAESQALLPPNAKETAQKFMPTLSATATATIAPTNTSVPPTSLPGATSTLSPGLTLTPTSTPTATVTSTPTFTPTFTGTPPEVGTQIPTEIVSGTDVSGGSSKKPTQKPRPTQKPKPTKANPNSGGNKSGDPPGGGNTNPKGGGNK
jgi:hypothetical protein